MMQEFFVQILLNSFVFWETISKKGGYSFSNQRNKYVDRAYFFDKEATNSEKQEYSFEKGGTILAEDSKCLKGKQ